MSEWKKIASFDVSYAPTKITKWVSKRSGLQLTYIAQDSPIVNGYFAVATEISDDSGAPHTLEHLVFMGSKKYPYKGLLDTIGNRLYSSTNAWTAVDQTVYTLQTAGWDGFKKLLPVYLDHLFQPTLTDAACKTEVYHIDGKGKERGVVFSEMQGIETQSWFISLLEMQRTLYNKEGGYSSETGGLTKELRSLTPDAIRKFHNDMYRSDNCCIIITGTVDEEELLQIVDEFDQDLVHMVPRKEKRPFVDSKPESEPANEIIREVEFPDRDESIGEIFMGWIGPSVDDSVGVNAIDIIGSYLTDSAISVLNREMVEIENPYATDIDFSTDDYLYTGISISLSGVPVERLKETDLKVKSLIAQQASVDVFDLNYIRQVINQQRLKYVSETEKSPQRLANIAILDFMYGHDNTIESWTKDLKEYDILLEWNSETWCSFIKKWFVDNNSVSILGKPSSVLFRKMKEEEKSMKSYIKEKYGKVGLKKLQDELEAAKLENDKELPESILTQFEQPDASKINFIKTEGFGAGANENYGHGKIRDLIDNDDDNEVDLFLHLEHYRSQFTSINLVASSDKVDPFLLKYMSIFEEIFTLPLKLPDGTEIPYEEVVSRTNDDLISFHVDNSAFRFEELISVYLKFESSKYTTAIDWLLKIIKYTVFTEERVRVILEKLINSIPDKKRNDELVMYSAQYRTLFTDKSIKKAQDFLNTEEFLKELLDTIKDGKFEKIQKDLELLRNQLFDLSNLKIFVVGNCEIKNPVSSWKPFVSAFPGTYQPDPISKIPHSYNNLSSIGEKCSKYAHLATIAATDTTHLLASAKVTTDYLDENIPAIALAQEYLSAVEGPFWRGIRGTGLAYGADIRRSHETGFITYQIYRGADAQEAWLQAKKIVDDYASGVTGFDKIIIENAVAATTNNLANSVSNSNDAATVNIIDTVFRDLGKDYISTFLKKLKTVTEDDLIKVMNTVFKPIFDSETSVIFACVPPANVGSFKSFLEAQGYNVTIEEINMGDDEEEEEYVDDNIENSELGSESECSDSECSDSECSDSECSDSEEDTDLEK